MKYFFIFNDEKCYFLTIKLDISIYFQDLFSIIIYYIIHYILLH